ncbi:hypothetical protein DFR52_1011044 [Hoeflea marina]|uniref:Uncharacterized protein n=2 Tax=Hoeflea marina TaxID=274592 RepID=A0A317PTT2_9HYPH|nr:hypothetical protein DFR52_1011044 [Hoeflea marina]
MLDALPPGTKLGNGLREGLQDIPTFSPRSRKPELLWESLRMDTLEQSLTPTAQKLAPHLTWTLGWALSTQAAHSKIVAPPEPLVRHEIAEGTINAREQAFSEYMREPLRNLGLDSSRWKLMGSSSGVEARTKLVRSLAGAAPTGKPELVFFLDRKDFAQPLREMTNAWKGETRELPPPDLVEAYVKSLAGKAVYLVGHIEGPAFIMKRSDGQVERHDVSHLVDLAIKYNVKLFPLGCRGVEAGAPVGFSRNITTTEVAAFLAEVPMDPTRMADLLKPFELLGDAWFNVDLVNNLIETAVVKTEGPTFTDAEARFKFSSGGPGGPPPPSGPGGGSGDSSGGGVQANALDSPVRSSIDWASNIAAEDFDDWFDEWRGRQLPWYWKGGIGQIVRYVPENPFRSAVILAFLLGGITHSAAWVSERPTILGSRKTAWIARAGSVVAMMSGVSLVLLIAAGILWFIAFWVMLFIHIPVIFVIAVALVGLLYLFKDFQAES